MAPLRGLIESPKGDCFIYMLSCKTTQLGHYIKHQHTDKRSINVFPRPQRQSSQLNSYPAFYPQIPNTVLGQTTDISFQVPANRQFKVPFLCHIHHHWNTKFFYHKKQRLVNKPSIVTCLTLKAAGTARSMCYPDYGSKTEESWFSSRQGQQIFLFSRLAQGQIQPHTQYISGDIFPGVGRGGGKRRGVKLVTNSQPSGVEFKNE